MAAFMTRSRRIAYLDGLMNATLWPPYLDPHFFKRTRRQLWLAWDWRKSKTWSQPWLTNTLSALNVRVHACRKQGRVEGLSIRLMLSPGTRRVRYEWFTGFPAHPLGYWVTLALSYQALLTIKVILTQVIKNGISGRRWFSPPILTHNNRRCDPN